MIASRTELAAEALEKALEVREEAGLDFKSPLNVFDLCGNLRPCVRVLFVDYSMEGCYYRGHRPTIKISALRPLVRRVFNCAHELGHHVFGHSSTVDELQKGLEVYGGNTPEEFLVNTFAGLLLMPKLGVRRAFSLRGWKVSTATPEQVYVVASHFGVGYATLANHLAYGLREISSSMAEKLTTAPLPKIRKALVGSDGCQRLQVVDQHFESPVVDTEVGSTLVLIPGIQVERDGVEIVRDSRIGPVFEAKKPGLYRAVGRDGWAVVIRVSRYQYSGWSQNRHLEEVEDDDE